MSFNTFTQAPSLRYYHVLEILSTSFVAGCLDNVQFCFSSDFQAVLQKPDIGMQRSTRRSTHRHQHTHTRMCSTAQDTLEFAQTEAVCAWVGCPSVGRCRAQGTEGRCGTEERPMISLLTIFTTITLSHRGLKIGCCTPKGKKKSYYSINLWRGVVIWIKKEHLGTVTAGYSQTYFWTY